MTAAVCPSGVIGRLTCAMLARTRLTSTSSRRWALANLALTELVVVLATTIVTVAFPQAHAEMGMNDVQRGWIVSTK